MESTSWISVGVNDTNEGGLKYAAQAAAAMHAHLVDTFARGKLSALDATKSFFLASGHVQKSGPLGPSSIAAQLAAVPRGLDCFLFYYAGHGTGGVSPTLHVDGNHAIGASDLDLLLSNIDAKSIVVILDCCFAGAISTALVLLRTSADRRRATLIASACTADQQAWEDDFLQMPVFSLYLHQALRFEPPSQPGNLAATVLAIALDVAAYATLKKGAVQTPVLWTSASNRISVGRSAQTMAQGPSFQQSLSRVLARLARRLALGILMVLVVLQSFTYHLRLSPAGYIEVVQGPQFLSGLMPPLLATARESPWRASEFLEQDARARLVRDGVSGIRTGLDEDGFERWLQGVWQLVGQAVNPEVQELRLSLGKDLEGRVNDGSFDALPERLQSLYAEAAGFESGYAWVLKIESERALLTRRESDFNTFEDLTRLLGYSCNEEDFDEWMELEIHQSIGKYPTDGLRPWLENFLYILATSKEHAFDRLVGVIQFLNLRWRLADRIPGVDVRQELAWLGPLSRAARHAGLSENIVPKLRAALAGRHCVQVLNLAVATLGAEVDPPVIEQWVGLLERESKDRCPPGSTHGTSCLPPDLADSKSAKRDLNLAADVAFLALSELNNHDHLSASLHDRIAAVPALQFDWTRATMGHVPESSLRLRAWTDEVAIDPQRSRLELQSILLSSLNYSESVRLNLSRAVPTWEGAFGSPTIFIRDVLPFLQQSGLVGSASYTIDDSWPEATTAIDFPDNRDNNINVIRLEAGSIRWEDLEFVLNAYAQDGLSIDRETQVLEWANRFLRSDWSVPDPVLRALSATWYHKQMQSVELVQRLRRARTAQQLKLEIAVAATTLVRLRADDSIRAPLIATLDAESDPIVRHALASTLMKELAMHVGDRRSD